MKTIRDYRIEKGLTQGELAIALGISDTAVSTWELGHVAPHPRMIPALARIFGISQHDAREAAEASKSKKTQAAAVNQ